MKLFKNTFIIMIWALAPTWADDVTITASDDAADGLNLEAVGQLLQEVNDAEHLERSLNDPELGLNNLDLDLDGQVDYIRVVTHDEGSTHVLVLQTPLGEDEFQDIATIDIDREDDDVVIQITGNEVIYGPNYYVHPVGVAWATVSFVNWIYSPVYRPWRSTVVFGVYPGWYRPWPRVHHHHYHAHAVGYTRTTFHVTHTNRVVRSRTVYAAPRVSVRVKAPVRNPTSHQVKAGVKVSKPRQGSQTTVGVKRTKTDKGTKTTVGAKKTTSKKGTTTTKSVKKERTKTKDKTTTKTTKSKTKKKGNKTTKTTKTKKKTKKKN